ncbi:MAG TPA: T9SS type A sorting domain-containing protein [Chryseosolibacter sp.]
MKVFLAIESFFVMRAVSVFFAVVFLFIGSHAQTISRAEYFFDTDPGVGNGIPIPIAVPSDNITFSATISTSGLSTGRHLMFVRTKTSDDRWSLYEFQEFIIEAGIEEAEYFFDVDPGVGNGFPVTISPGATVLSRAIPTTGVSAGTHLLFMRTKQAGTWSLATPVQFHIEARIVAAEYFIDTDPGFGNGTPIAISSPAEELTINEAITVGALASGPHNLFIRTKDVLGVWSMYEPQAFTIDPALPVELTDFRATATQEGNVVLSWSTASEKNTSHFVAMRSDDAISFTQLAQVAAAGESKIPRNYHTIDHYPTSGNNYYQLKMVDRDGKMSNSKIAVARINKKEAPALYPNPATSHWVVDFSLVGDDGFHSFELFDLSGRNRMSIQTSDERVVRMSREGLANGFYLLKITSVKSQWVYKISLR